MSLKTFVFVITCCVVCIISSCSKQQAIPAQKVLERTIGSNALRFSLSLEESIDSLDWFEIEVKNNRINITGNSTIALCKGAYHFIKENNFGVVTWEGTNVKIPDELESKSYDRVSVSMPLRMYINPCTYGYTMAWWDWGRWEKELDWMAIHGINMPIALLGQEAIWQQVWGELGIEKSNLNDYYCGPAFLPWFRMGNIYNHVGPLPQSWMAKDMELQQKIMTRMKELGMHPVVPAFSGHVPPYFKNLYPNSKIYELKNWGGLEPEKTSYLLDPKDSLFTVVGKKFLKKYEQTYGKADLFLADAFNEMLPPVSDENKNAELADYGEAIYQSIKEHNPEATWVLQGWTFGHQSYFWNSESTRAFFSKVPKDNLLMLNYGEDRYPIWEKLEAFYGYQWTYGYVHNYGGQQSLFGDFNLYYIKYRELINHPNKGNLVGYGCLPEGIEKNSIVYEYIFDIPWGATDKPVSNWINNHITNRYGQLSPNTEQAWDIALKNTYTVKEWKLQTNKLGYGTYIHNNRPTLDVQSWGYTGQPDSIKLILPKLIEEYEQGNQSELLYYDIIDFAQHYTAYQADKQLIQVIKEYNAGNYQIGDSLFSQCKKFLKKLEVLQVETDGSFTKWCADAITHAKTEEEKKLYLKNAKTQITIWGGNRLKDYASKSWSGILTDFYIPRWQMLFDEVKQEKSSFDLQATQKKIREWEEKWTENNSIPASPDKLKKEEYIELVTQILRN